MKFLLKVFPILFLLFPLNNFVKASGINCSLPIHKNKKVCRDKSETVPKIDPKEFIEKVTVSITGINGDAQPGSGVLIKKEGNVYSVLTAAHVICNRQDRFIDTEEYAVTVDKYMFRHFVKPGITGLAQVKGLRGETKSSLAMEHRIRLDTLYIENWSLILDIKIIVLTIINVFKGDEKAY